MEDPLAELDDRQREAVTWSGGPLLVVAGPGTGKTRVLVHRIAHLIRVHGIRPAGILAVTFTNRAARELAERLAALIGAPGDAEGVLAGTFHAISLRLLREFRTDAGLPEGFRVLDEDERAGILRRIGRAHGIDPARLGKALSAGKTRGEPHEDPTLEPAVAAYAERLRALGALDFDDLVSGCVRLWRERPDVRDTCRRRFRYILVDEYQDADAIQYRWVREIAGEGRGLCAIGDPDQAIYAFRGANVGNFLHFERDFPGARRVALAENYRSTETIVRASEQVIAENRERIERALRAVLPGGVRITIHESASDRAEATWIARTVDRLLGGVSLYSIDSGRADTGEEEEWAPGDIAILCRLNAQTRPIAEALAEAGIPFERVGGEGGVGRALRALLALIRAILAPEDEAARERLAGLAGLADAKEADAIAAACRGSLPRDPRGLPDLWRAAGLGARLGGRPEIEGAIAAWAASAPPGETWEAFLDRAALSREADRFRGASDRVSLLTIHAAKGLEFPVVFIAGCEDGLLPYRRGDELPDMEEERRLFYVGMTRAGRRLILTRARRRFLFGRTVRLAPSPFVEAIAAELREAERRAREARRETEEGPEQLTLF